MGVFITTCLRLLGFVTRVAVIHRRETIRLPLDATEESRECKGRIQAIKVARNTLPGTSSVCTDEARAAVAHEKREKDEAAPSDPPASSALYQKKLGTTFRTHRLCVSKVNQHFNRSSMVLKSSAILFPERKSRRVGASKSPWKNQLRARSINFKGI
ncbi:hypothetical protein B0H19DRAFT_1086576 [Mycena capillaripes]|nr:hypothetical protein B0H19DRAFT_1086576 [Mycena capillaripes]